MRDVQAYSPSEVSHTVEGQNARGAQSGDNDLQEEAKNSLVEEDHSHDENPSLTHVQWFSQAIASVDEHRAATVCWVEESGGTLLDYCTGSIAHDI